MLVRFDSDAGVIIMFGDVAVKLLKMMGQSGAVPGAILPHDIPAALERLRQGLATYQDPPSSDGNGDRNGEPPVTLRQRAFPLIELLARAAKRKCHVIWEEERPLLG